MELEAPIKISEQSYTVKLHVENPIEVSYPSRESGTHTTPIDTLDALQPFLQQLGALYETYSKRYFHVAMPIMGFIRRLSHVWQFESHQPYSGPAPDPSQPPILVKQLWLPEQLHVLPRIIQLHWKLVHASYSVQQPSGFANGEPVADPILTDSIPMNLVEGPAMNLALAGTRARALRKVREARMRAAAAKWRADFLIARYYERYGTTELVDGDSILSSDEEEAVDVSNTLAFEGSR